MTAPGEGVQALLARMLVDPGLVREVRAAPDLFAARHNADPEQVRSLAESRIDGLDAAVRVTAVKRRRHVRHLFPGTFALADRLPEAKPLLDFQEFGDRITSLADTADVGRRLKERAETLETTDGADVLREMIAFETLWYEAGAEAEAAEPAPPSGYPALPAGVALATFTRPIAEFHRRVDAGAGIDVSHIQATHYALKAGQGERVRVHRLPDRLRDLLKSCDGRTASEEIAQRLALPCPEVERALTRMSAKGLVTPAQPRSAEGG